MHNLHISVLGLQDKLQDYSLWTIRWKWLIGIYIYYDVYLHL